MPDNRELLNMVEAWARANYPGCPLELVTIQLRFLPAPIQLPACPGLPQPPPAAAPGEAAEQESQGGGLPQCVLDILQTLREAKRPLSRTLLLEEMARKGRLWAESTVAGYLAKLIQDGTLSNPERQRPRGYRLAENEPE